LPEKVVPHLGVNFIESKSAEISNVKTMLIIIIIIIFVSSDTASGGEESPLLYKYIRTKPYNVKPYM